MSAFQVHRHVAFSETDAAGILHFARYPVWMEDAEHAFLRSLGFTAHEAGGHMFPRVRVEVDHGGPLTYHQGCTVHVDVDHVGRSSVRYRFAFVPDGADDPIARGVMTAVCCTQGPDGLASSPIPDDLRAALVGAMATS